MKDDNFVYAPVLIPTLCRYEHFKRCVESLSACTGADKTVLYIGLDYPTKESHWEGYKKIEAYLPSISGFKDVIIFKRSENFGPMKNARSILAIIEQSYDRYIFSEDDNEFSPNFLEYINGGLNKYKDNKDVIAICGYSEPKADYRIIDSYPYNAYPIIGYNAWGVGVWFEKRAKLIPAEEIVYNIKNIIKAIRADHGVAVHRMLFRMRNNAISDLQWRLYCAYNKKYCIFPKVSKVRNWGFDGSGENSIVVKSYLNTAIDDAPDFHYDNFEIKDYPLIKKLQKKLYGWSLINYIVFTLDYTFFRVSGGKCFYDYSLYNKLVRFRREISGKNEIVKR